MKKLLLAILLVSIANTAYALPLLTVPQAGTGSSTLTGILIGNGVSPIQSTIIGSGLSLSGTTLSPTGGLQTPWTSNIAAGGYALTNAGQLTFTSFVGTSTATSTLSGGLYASLISAPYFNATSSSATSTLQDLFWVDGQATSLTLSGAISFGSIN